MGPRPRRTFLATVGGGIAGLAAGCLGTGQSDDAPSATPLYRTEPTPSRAGSSTPETTTELDVSGDWPSFQYDGTNAGSNPELGSGVGGGGVAWYVGTGSLGRVGPTVADGTVYVMERWSGTTRVTARNAADGTLDWSALPPDTGNGPAAAIGGGRVVLTATDSVYALGTDTGEQRWTYVDDGYFTTAPALVDGSVLVASRDTHDTGDGAAVHSIDAGEGTRQWVYPLDADVEASVAVAEETAVVGDTGGTIHGIDTASGERRWHSTVDAGFGTAPAIRGGTAYLVDVEGIARALNLEDGTERWQIPVGQPRAGVGVAVTDRRVFAGGRDRLHALDAASGTVDWAFETDGWTSTPAVGGGVVYAGDRSRVYGWEVDTGDPRWSLPLPSVSGGGDVVMQGVGSPTAPVDGGVFVHAVDGLYAFGPGE